MVHLTFEQLVDYVEGRLDSAELVNVQAHLATGCASCQMALAWLEQSLSTMTADDWISPPPEISETVRQLFPVTAVSASTPFWQRRLVWGTIVLIVILLIFSWFFFSLPKSNDREPIAVPTATSTPVLPTPTRAELRATAVPTTLTPTSNATATTVIPVVSTPTTTDTPTFIPVNTVTLTPSSTATLTATAVPPTMTSAPPSQPTPPPDDDDDGDDDDGDDSDNDN